ncbi:RNA pseudouridylate synthase domain-containing protein 2 isoform X1 [Hypomesus transpacificus]|uniref:RNA pseudouridylate synthase domain-containing protein 2 isoform X1 n=2 Tax=Hypomesus transpacificus TaxID=137520 RepID=UPI001F07C37C|nr:RNA pseudouridylate synthase domain-containing protein 2 isoform X1 [Hypomesus transpacificus]
MHVSVLTPTLRVHNLCLTIQTVILKNGKQLDSVFGLFLRYIKTNVYGCQYNKIDCIQLKLSLGRRRCTLPKCNATFIDGKVNWKVTKYNDVGVRHNINAFLLYSRSYRQQTPMTTQQMETIEATDAAGKNISEITSTTKEYEVTGTVKRKSEEGVETEKDCRGKRRRGGGGKNMKPGERYIPPPQKRNPGVGFSQEHFDETSYYFEGGLRKVRPYYFDFKTYCKGRWIGKSLLEVFSKEFRAESLDYYKAAAKEGRIRLNEEPVNDLSITLRNNDHMKNTVHRHEPPVVGRPLEILEDNGEVLVVDKPASMPVHPCGRFRHNTVIFILGKERGISGLHTVHRLDRLTSGVLLFARTLEVSKRLDKLVRDRQLEKEYVCRVEGEFPEAEVVCEEPILVVSFKVGLCRVDPLGKDCRTVFQRLSYNGSNSVVRCMPLTGRTHQIRVHLQFLGFPILNDPIYGSSAWGPERAKGGLVGLSDEELLKALLDEHRSKESLHLLDLPEDASSLLQEGIMGVGVNGKDLQNAACDTSLTRPDESGGCSSQTHRDVSNECTELQTHPVQPVSTDCTLNDMRPLQGAGKDGALSGCAPAPLSGPRDRDPLCSECKITRPDPTEKELIMYLHALRYKGPDFEYKTCLPYWAKEDWVDD